MSPASRPSPLHDQEQQRAARDTDPLRVHCRELAANVYLLTYTLLQSQRRTRRSSIWSRASGDWKIVFHQGTEVADA